MGDASCNRPIPESGPPGAGDDLEVGALFLSNSTVIYFLATSAILLGVVGILGNIIVLSYYSSQVKTVLPLIYVSLATVDLLGGVSAITIGSGLFWMIRDFEDIQYSVVMDFVFVLFNTTCRVSVFCNVVLVVSRSINIVWHNYKVRYKAVLASLGCNVLFWIAFCVTELVLVHRNTCVPLPPGMDVGGDPSNITDAGETGGPPGGPPDDSDDVIPPGEGLPVPPTVDKMLILQLYLTPLVGKDIYRSLNIYSSLLEVTLLKGIPFLIPSFIAIICMFIHAYKLMYTSMGRRSKISRRITLTVLYLTIVYITCNIPDFLLILILPDPMNTSSTYDELILRFTAAMMLPFINGCISPLILIVRGRKLKKYLVDSVKSVTGSKSQRSVTRKSMTEISLGRSVKETTVLPNMALEQVEDEDVVK